MTVTSRLLMVMGFALGVFADDIGKSVREAYTKLHARKLTVTAESIQRNFIEERRKMMGDARDDD